MLSSLVSSILCGILIIMTKTSVTRENYDTDY